MVFPARSFISRERIGANFQKMSFENKETVLIGLTINQARKKGYIGYDNSRCALWEMLPKGDLWLVSINGSITTDGLLLYTDSGIYRNQQRIIEIVRVGSLEDLRFEGKKMAITQAPNYYNPTILVGHSLDQFQEAGLIDLPRYVQFGSSDLTLNGVPESHVFSYTDINGLTKYYWAISEHRLKDLSPVIKNIEGPYNSPLIAKFANYDLADEDLYFVGHHYQDVDIIIERVPGNKRLAYVEFSEAHYWNGRQREKMIWIFFLDEDGIIKSWIELEGRINTQALIQLAEKESL